VEGKNPELAEAVPRRGRQGASYFGRGPEAVVNAPPRKKRKFLKKKPLGEKL
jgi:hypothetical protein